MVGPHAAQLLGQALIAPAAILVLCIVAGVGTVMLLPGRREGAFRKIGGAVALAAGLVLAALVARSAVPRSAGDGYFWVFSAIAVAAALRVISHTRPVYSALYFVLTVLASAGLFVLLHADFMAAALVLIYAGAILVTYVFVIMLAANAGGGGAEGAEYDLYAREPVWACAVGFAVMGVMLFVIFDKAGALPAPAAVRAGDSVRDLGLYLIKDHLVSLQLAGVLLTVAMVGAVIVARRYLSEAAPDVSGQPAALGDDNPHNIPVFGTDNPRQKQYPET